MQTPPAAAGQVAAEVGTPDDALAPITARPLTEADGLTVDLATALAMGLAHDRTLRQAGLDRSSARHGITRAWSVYHPQVTLDASASKFDSAVTGITTGAGASATERHQVALSVNQLIFDLGQGLFSIYQSRQTAKAAGFAELATGLNSANRIAANFYEVLRTDALLSLAEAVVDQSTRQLEQTQARFDVGQLAQLEVIRSQVALSNAEVDLAVAANNQQLALAALRRDLGIAPATPLTVTDTTTVPPVEIELAEALELTEEVPSVIAAAARRSGQKNALDSARVRRWANLRVTGNFDQYLSNSRNVNNEYVLSATVSLPLWDGLNLHAAAEQARLAWERADEQLQAEREQVRLDIEQAYTTHIAAASRLNAAELAAQLAAESLTQTEESFQLDASSNLDVIDARTEFQRAESNRINARLERDLAAIALRLSIGRLPLTDAALEATSDLWTPVPPPAVPTETESVE
ncbi:MAG TPA: hypothetical protein DCZ72_05505 [Armatimonadetes bacterium]|nr:hypothetical protein [Armatimonadota bacterium]